MGAIRCLEAARSAVVTGRARAIIMRGRMFAIVVDCGVDCRGEQEVEDQLRFGV